MTAPHEPIGSTRHTGRDVVFMIVAVAVAMPWLVLRFQGSWCKTCTAQAPAIQRLAEKYRSRDVEVIGVHVNDTAAEARAWRKRYKQTYGAVLDPGARMASRFGFKLAPYTVVIDKRGEIVKRITGSADEARLTKLLDPLLAASPPSPTPR